MQNLPTLPSLLLATALDRMISRGMFDNTFADLHQLSWFDWIILVPYFSILALLSVYGIFRFQTIFTYYRHRKNATGEPPQKFAELPRVTIQLPLFNERYV